MSFFVVKQGPRGSKGFTLVLGKAVAKRATERNLLKRRIRAVLRPIVGDARSGFVIIVRPGANHLTFEQIKEELTRAIASINK